jgi:hypothetical protein
VAPVARSVRALIHAAALALVATWIAAPERTGPFFGALGGGLAAVSLALALAARTRPRLARALERTRRGLDLATLAFVATFGLAEVELRVLARFVRVPLLAPPTRAPTRRSRRVSPAPGAPRAARCERAGSTSIARSSWSGGRTRASSRSPTRSGWGRRRARQLPRGSTTCSTNDGRRAERAAAPPAAGAAGDDPVEVLNFGVICTSPREYLQLWRTGRRATTPTSCCSASSPATIGG